MLRSKLKKAVVATGLVAAIATSVNAAADNEIIITGTVSSSVVVGFADVSGQAANTGLFVGADIDVGTVLPGADFTTVSNSIYVKTNHTGGIGMTITDSAAAAGVLKDTLAVGADIPVTYTLNGAGYTVGTTGSVTITTGINDGTGALANPFIVNPDAAAADQSVGTYTATLNVAIAAL